MGHVWVMYGSTMGRGGGSGGGCSNGGGGLAGPRTRGPEDSRARGLADPRTSGRIPSFDHTGALKSSRQIVAMIFQPFSTC